MANRKAKAGPGKGAQEQARFDWEHNHEIISEACVRHLMAHGRFPTVRAITKATGFNKNTVDKHLATLREKTLAERFKNVKAISDKVLACQALKAFKGDTQAAKLYFELVEGFKEGKEIDLKMNGFTREEKEEMLKKLVGGGE